jgi:hypothetical protein
MKISIDVPDAQGKALQDAARRLNVPAEELASAAVGDLLTQGEAEFERVAQRVLEKNRDLYRRLA